MLFDIRFHRTFLTGTLAGLTVRDHFSVPTADLAAQRVAELEGAEVESPATGARSRLHGCHFVAVEGR